MDALHGRCKVKFDSCPVIVIIRSYYHKIIPPQPRPPFILTTYMYNLHLRSCVKVWAHNYGRS